MTTRIFEGRYESLKSVAEFVRHEGMKAGLSTKETFELETAVDEAVSNIIEHAYGGEGLGEITCSTEILDGGIQIVLEDTGQPFDPTCIPLPNIKAPLEEREDHGLGYYLMCQLMDDVQFEFDQNHNKLTLIKKRE